MPGGQQNASQPANSGLEFLRQRHLQDSLPHNARRDRERSSALASQLAERLFGDTPPFVSQEALHALLEEWDCPQPTIDEQLPTPQQQAQEEQHLSGSAADQQPPAIAFHVPAPPPLTLLQPGMSFHGQQCMTTQAGSPHSRVLVAQSGLSQGSGPKQDSWAVSVTLLGYDHSQGTVCGHMQASNLPNEAAPVTTYFEGEIVDNNNHTFYTPRWGATAASDIRHWRQLPGFAALQGEVVASGGRAAGLAESAWAYLRIKEQFFVQQGEEGGLSIAGFYYLALHRVTGEVQGLYYDPASMPDQALALSLCCGSGAPGAAAAGTAVGTAHSCTPAGAGMGGAGRAAPAPHLGGIAFADFELA